MTQHAKFADSRHQGHARSVRKPADPLGSVLQDGNLARLASAIQRSPQLLTPHLKPNDIHYLQRSIGNRAVATLLGRNTPADARNDASIGAQGGQVEGTTAQAIQRAAHGGKPVPEPVAADVQRSMGVDVRHARIHTGKHADTLSRKLNAEAFTHGRDIFFGKDAYQPGTVSGKQLLAHELTHVAQQTGVHSSRVQRKLQVGPAQDRFEQAADRVAASVAARRTDAAPPPQATGRALVQRRLKFKPEDLDGEVSKRGKFAGKLGFESTFSKIQRYLTDYWNAGKDIQLQLTLLTKMKALVEQWFKRFERKHDIDANQGLKSMSLYKLKQDVDTELPKVKDKVSSVDFMKNFGVQSETVMNYPFVAAQDTDFAIGKKIHQLEKNNLPLPESSNDLKVSDGMGGEKGILTGKSQWGGLRDKYRNEKHLGLTPADRAAIGMYTGDQFIWMNPAMAGNKDWFQSSVVKKYGESDPRSKNEKWQKSAMEANKQAGAQLIAALNKLPDWQQDKTIYRGETVPEAEAQQLQEGSVKNFPFFVSTSQETSTPLGMMNKFRSDARPWGVLYYITSSTSGKNIRPWSVNAGEQEILFAPNTNFYVTKVISRDDSTKTLKLEVQQH